MQRNEGPAYHGRPVGGILPEVSWIPDASRSNSAILFDPTGEHCSRTAPAESTSGKISRGPLSNLLSHPSAGSLPLSALKSHTVPTAALTSLAMNASQMSASVSTSTSSGGGGSGSHSQSQGVAGGGSAGGSGGSSASVASSQFQRLKVEDALSYLDQVKLQFGNQPQVYNDFLDIMKEFKSQSIDTPGVISRVSNLFKGHPDLIVGFNTFLPPGFKIEVHHNEINISGPAQHSQTLAKIAQAHNSSNNSSSSAKESSGHSQSSSTQSSSTSTSRGSGGVSGGGASSGSSNSGPNQPVEFNHAISYVNKIKNRFQQHPDIYKQFLEILHKYQKEQRQLKEGGGSTAAVPLTESEVYSQVSSLFQNQDDLLAEFGQFLPDATSVQVVNSIGPPPSKKPALSSNSTKTAKPAHGRKTSQSGLNSSGNSQSKKPKSSAKDVLAEAGKHTNYVELALFDKIQKAFRNQEVYTNFLRCLVLFNEEIISRHELVQLVTPFLGKFPELFNSFKTLLGFKDPGLPEQLPTASPTPLHAPKERVTEFAAEIDYKSLKRHGASYRALPKTYVQPKCSGRTQLCNEVLNDTWVSFPMWSEDSTFEGTRKTQFEEYIFRCEDERFELDVVLETNLSTIRYLEALQKKMSKMASEDLSKFSLEDKIGGNSDVLQRKAIHRIYGDKAHDIIEGLKKSPSVAVPVVLKRLKAKQEEWLEAQKAFNKTWRDQLEKYYLKSLDHQGINFKQIDTRAMRSKALCSEVESIYDERQEQMAEGASPVGPHLKLFFPAESCVFTDAVGLVMYYTKRASSLQHSDALKIKSFLTHTLSSILYYPRAELSSEDDLSPDSDSDAMDVDSTAQEPPPSSSAGAGGAGGAGSSGSRGDKRQGGQQLGGAPSAASSANGKTGTVAGALVPDTAPQFAEMDYHVIFANNSLYTLFRLFQILCDRLNKIYQQALVSIKEEEQQPNSVPIAIKLGLKKPPDIRVREYYPTFLSMAKNFMEGNIDSSTYEDTCREMFGVHAFVVFTIDRLVQNIVRQLHTLVSDENCYKMMEHYAGFVEQLTATHLRAESRVGAEAAYQKSVETLLGEDNCFKIIFDKEHLVSFELLDTDENGEESNGHDMKRWQAYVEKYGRPDEGVDPELKEILAKRKIFLKRSLRFCPNSSENEEKLKALLPNMEICGAIEFKMDKKSYRMIPLAKSEDYLYSKQSLKRARQVNDKVLHRKRAKFQSWHSQWLSSNLTTQESTLCTDWLLGKVQQLPPQGGSPEDDGAVIMTGSSPLTECTKELYLGVERSRYTTRPRKHPPPPPTSSTSSTVATSGPTEPPEPMSTD